MQAIESDQLQIGSNVRRNGLGIYDRKPSERIWCKYFLSSHFSADTALISGNIPHVSQVSLMQIISILRD